ncbi:nicotinate-nucleotide--dimethylbenzimidazole phosphoribosyltransferase [Thermopetrobacter sp. TC1]|uniref:nicotinate-nucleotide--dimethylbenzimidazole phosphoribosyltransferase n=1 Tax=Thermopetrobacter sp. TC1 TaxID=1495045 RepID=UPI00056DB96D|nr:nicotinate-nucleotide--dimethylbenzimidazole phosphoribosyltransferase [Thermopetrobacter sp. TC1]
MHDPDRRHQPLDDIRAHIAAMPGPDTEAEQKARARDRYLTKPPGALGRLEEIAFWLSAWQGRHPPSAERIEVAVFAANHGVAARGVSAYPAEVTAQMVANFRAGGAAINQICTAFGLGLKVHELALEKPTADITKAPAMSEKECAATIAYGFQAVEDQPDVLCLGEMGIANTTIASALLAALYGGPVRDWVGPGTGVDEAGIARKVAVIEEALALHGPHLDDPLEILRRLGGREFAAILGAIIAARHARVPVILDGFMVTAAAAILHALDPAAIDHCIAGHVSAEPAHARALEKIGKRPLLDLDMRLGEGTGAGLAAAIIRAAAATHGGMATFAEAGVSNREE